MPTEETEERLRFWRENEYAAQALVAKAGTSKGYVVIVADSRDPLGHDLASVSCERGGVDFEAYSRKVLAKNQIPTAVFMLETAVAQKILGPHMPTIAERLGGFALPEGMLFAVIVSGGGSSLIAVAVKPRPTPGLS